MPGDDKVRAHQQQLEILKKTVIPMLLIVFDWVFAVCWLPVDVLQMDESVKMEHYGPVSSFTSATG